MANRGVAAAYREGDFKGRDLYLKEWSTEGQNLALTVLVVPNSLDSGPRIDLKERRKLGIQ